MPELPEVETIKEAMQKAVCGAVIESVEVRQRQLRQQIPVDLEKIITGAKIRRLYRVAKYAIMELDNGYSVVWHFGMSGKIKIVGTNTDVNLEKHDHVILKTNLGNLIYNDPRRFGLVTLIESDKFNLHPLFAHLGVDPFDVQLTAAYLKEAFKNKRIPIKIALLDQSIICGIGNIYASEALYEARISPLRTCCSLQLKEIKNLIAAIKKTLAKAIQAGGSTLHDYRQPDGQTGYFQLQHAVYGKDGKKCPNCRCKKDHILKIIQGGRSTYYCPCLQK
ncbi:MAG: bifunctional DNA-formamidopyrimidine glycosylase/DNA-(apurinic or apyrimidinic site) lyase [Alphaproteobacteria bacterium]|nr:bifunctional DNA-formamidopyrimidine glycosylase/DNA-(apurinic or apyrimidinic site) lyase [Alphaproteobacteria bacterium]